MNLKRNTLLVAPLVGIILTGCMHNPPKSEYTALAQAGGQYAAAIDKTLTAAGVAQVDSTSWALVMDKEDGRVSETNYTGSTKADKARLKEISRLRAHAKLLGGYFGHLESLATSDAPEKTKTAMDGVVAGLQKVPWTQSQSQAISALSPLVEFIVDMKIRAALKEEFDTRKDVIRRELQIQEKLLQTLTGQISHALKLQIGAKEQQLVMDPITSRSPLKNAEKWVSTRRDVLYLTTMIEEIHSASNAAKKMREAFEALLSGEDTMGRINALIMDIESILAVVDTIKS